MGVINIAQELPQQSSVKLRRHCRTHQGSAGVTSGVIGNHLKSHQYSVATSRKLRHQCSSGITSGVMIKLSQESPQKS